MRAGTITAAESSLFFFLLDRSRNVFYSFFSYVIILEILFINTLNENKYKKPVKHCHSLLVQLTNKQHCSCSRSRHLFHFTRGRTTNSFN